MSLPMKIFTVSLKYDFYDTWKPYDKLIDKGKFNYCVYRNYTSLLKYDPDALQCQIKDAVTYILNAKNDNPSLVVFSLWTGSNKTDFKINHIFKLKNRCSVLLEIIDKNNDASVEIWYKNRSPIIYNQHIGESNTSSALWFTFNIRVLFLYKIFYQDLMREFGWK